MFSEKTYKRILIGLHQELCCYSYTAPSNRIS